jgi:hypothetical protein
MLNQMLKEKNLSLGTFLRLNRMDTLSSGYLVWWLIFIMPIISVKSDILFVCLSGCQTVIRLLDLFPEGDSSGYGYCYKNGTSVS